MIKRIIGVSILFCMIVALFLSFLNFTRVEVGGSFLTFLYQCNLELESFKVEIPNIPNIPYMEESNPFLVILNAFISFANGLSSVLNIIIQVLNYVISLLQFIVIVIKNISNFISSLVEVNSSSEVVSEVLSSI